MCEGFWGCMGHGFKVAGKWAVDHRGLLATVGATLGCFVPAVGWVACAGLQAAAFGVRTEQTISEDGGWEKNKKEIAVDAALTVGTVGVAAPFRLARYGTLAGAKNAPLIPLPKFISSTNARAMEGVQTEAWNQLGWRAATFQGLSWNVPSVMARQGQKYFDGSS